MGIILFEIPNNKSVGIIILQERSAKYHQFFINNA